MNNQSNFALPEILSGYAIGLLVVLLAVAVMS